jgi:hypothetical protein
MCNQNSMLCASLHGCRGCVDACTSLALSVVSFGLRLPNRCSRQLRVTDVIPAKGVQSFPELEREGFAGPTMIQAIISSQLETGNLTIQQQSTAQGNETQQLRQLRRSLRLLLPMEVIEP